MEAGSARKAEVTFDFSPALSPLGGGISPTGADRPVAEGVVLPHCVVFFGISKTRKVGFPPLPCEQYCSNLVPSGETLHG